MPTDAPTAPLTYDAAGVDYDRLDAFKRACQRAAAGTSSLLEYHGLKEVPGTRGESAYLFESDTEYLAHVEEGLGTKNLVADAVARLTGKTYYRAIGIDTVATIVNDLVTTGALPTVVAMHLAVGDSSWFDDAARAEALVGGFAEGCRVSGAAWGGGETPALRGVVEPGACVLAGSAVGRIAPKSGRIAGDVEPGDTIVFLASNGVQTNGLTLCRALAEDRDRLPDGYLTPMGDGRAFGEALLDPSAIYAAFVDGCRHAGVALRYAVHVTGHGWRKLMRLDRPLVYRVDRPTPDGTDVPAVFRFLMDRGPISETEAYATFNMGVGFAAYVRPGDVERCLAVAKHAGHTAWHAGEVVGGGGRKAVEVPSLGIAYGGDSLAVR